MLMSYQAEIVRGWPYDGALDLVEHITSGGTVSNGDFVVKKTDGTIDRLSVVYPSGTITNVAVGLAVQGNGDSPLTSVNGISVGNSSAASATPGLNTTTGVANVASAGKAVVVWGNFIADIQVTNAVAATFTPGAPFTFKAGAISAVASTTEPVFGYVVAVVGNTGASATESSRIRIKVA